MDLATKRDELFEPAPSDKGAMRWLRPGVLVSILLHAAVILLLLYLMNVPLPSESDDEIVPVDVVELAPQTTQAAGKPAAGPPQRTAPPQRRAQTAPKRAPTTPLPPVAVAPDKVKPPPDELDDKLAKLAKLRQPETAPNASEGLAASSGTGGNNGTGKRTAYRVEDLIRMQVERRWNLDLAELGNRNIIVALHVVMKGDGTVTLAEVVDTRRYNTDAKYRSIAISARNALRLASPIALPAGSYEDVYDITLTLNPRNVLR